MTTYAVGLRVSLPSDIDDFSSWFYERYDGALEEHDGTTVLRAFVDGTASALVAAKGLIEALRTAHVTVDAVDLDIVNMTDIAARAGVTRQYVAQLVGGAAGPGNFPRPLAFPGRSRVWHWGGVNEWLRQVGRAEDEVHLSYGDVCELEVWLRRPAMWADRLGLAQRSVASGTELVRPLDIVEVSLSDDAAPRGRTGGSSSSTAVTPSRRP